MLSGGKDSTFAIDSCLEKGWEIEYLISVKPTRKDCFLFHFATVEHTPKIAEILGLKHILTTCDVADPKLEADIIKNIVAKNKVDAVVLGGTGLQETQIRSVQEALRPLGVEAFASHAGFDHSRLMEEMINKGYKIMITQVAAEGAMPWLGTILTKDNLKQLFADAQRYGFHSGGDGGPYDSIVLDCPMFNKKLEIVDYEKIVDDAYSGHIVINKLNIIEKIKVPYKAYNRLSQ